MTIAINGSWFVKIKEQVRAASLETLPAVLERAFDETNPNNYERLNRQLSLILHPDKEGGSDAKMQVLTNIYSVKKTSQQLLHSLPGYERLSITILLAEISARALQERYVAPVRWLTKAVSGLVALVTTIVKNCLGLPLWILMGLKQGISRLVNVTTAGHYDKVQETHQISAAYSVMLNRFGNRHRARHFFVIKNQYDQKKENMTDDFIQKNFIPDENGNTYLNALESATNVLLREKEPLKRTQGFQILLSLKIEKFFWVDSLGFGLTPIRLVIQAFGDALKAPERTVLGKIGTFLTALLFIPLYVVLQLTQEWVVKPLVSLPIGIMLFAKALINEILVLPIRCLDTVRRFRSHAPQDKQEVYENEPISVKKEVAPSLPVGHFKSPIVAANSPGSTPEQHVEHSRAVVIP